MKNSKMSKLVVIIYLFCLQLVAYGQASDFGPVKYHPDMSLHLGAAFDANYTLTEKQQCIAYDEVVWLDGNGAVETTLEIKLVDDYRKLYEEMNLDVNMEAGLKLNKIVKFGGSASLKSSFEKKFNVEERMITLLIKARSDYGRVAMKNRQLKPEFQQMITAGKHQEFIQRCGRYFVSQERRGAEVYVLINIKDLSESAQKKLTIDYSSSFKADFKIVNASGSLKINFSNFIEKAAKLGKIEMKYYAVGTQGISGLENLIRDLDPKDLKKILNAMADVIATSTKENAAPLQYNIASMTQFGLQVPQFDPIRYDYISKVYKGLQTLNSNIEKIEAISNTRRTAFANYYSGKLSNLKSHRQQLINAATNCINQENCNETVFRYFEKIIWPQDMVDRSRLEVHPTYTKVVNQSGIVVGEILTDISVRVKGVLYHRDYFSQMAYAYFDENQRLKELNNLARNQVNISPYSREQNGVTYYDYSALMDFKTVRFPEYHQNGYVLSSAKNRVLAEQLLKEFKTRNYLLSVISNDGLQTTYNLGLGRFSRISAYKR